MFRQHEQRQSALSCAQHVRGRKRTKTNTNTAMSSWAVELLELLTMGIESIHSQRICWVFRFVSSLYLLCHIKMQINVLTQYDGSAQDLWVSIDEWNKDFVRDVVLLLYCLVFTFFVRKCQVQIHNRYDENFQRKTKTLILMQPANWIRGEHQ